MNFFNGNFWVYVLGLMAVVVVYLFARYNQKQGYNFWKTFIMSLLFVVFVVAFLYKNV